MSARRERWNRVAWWIRLDWYRNDGWRWRVAQVADKFHRQCWADLVSWALRSHEDDPDTPFWDAVRRLPYRQQTLYCHEDALRNGACYCAKVRTAEADADMCARGSKPASVIVRGGDE